MNHIPSAPDLLGTMLVAVIALQLVLKGWVEASRKRYLIARSREEARARRK